MLPKNRSRLPFLAWRQLLQQGFERFAVLHAFQCVIDHAQGVGDGGRILIAGIWGVQGDVE